MTDQQGWPLPSTWRNQSNRGHINQNEQEDKEDFNLQDSHRLNIRIIGPPKNRHGASASQSYSSSRAALFGPNSDSVPDIPTPQQQHRNAKSLSFLAPPTTMFGAPQGNNTGNGEDMYKDLLKRLNNMGVEVPGHTDKARNRAPGDNALPTSNINPGVFATPQSVRPAQPDSNFPYFGGSQGIENSIAALINDDVVKGNNNAGYLPSPENSPPNILPGYGSQTLLQSQSPTMLQTKYANSGCGLPSAQQQHHFRNHSLGGSSRPGALPPNCATAATFTPAGYQNPAPSTVDVPIPFKPMMMVQGMHQQNHHHQQQPDLFLGPTIHSGHPSPDMISPAALAGSGCSDNYKGNHFLPSNRSANIPDKDNCSFFITGLPPGIDTHTLLAHIVDVGRVFASYINDANPGAGHLTAAAKLVFFEKVAAQHFWSRHREQLPLMVSGYAAKVVRNRIKVAEPDWPRNYTRVVVISGPAEVIQTTTLLKIFEANFVFHIDEIIEDPLETPAVDVEQGWELPEGWRTIEIRFGSWRSQAQTSFQVLGNHPDYRGVRIRYGRDPCDRIPDSERHLYRVMGGGVMFGCGSEDQLGLGGRDDDDCEDGNEDQNSLDPIVGSVGVVTLGSSVGSLATSPLLHFTQGRSTSDNSNNSSGTSSGKSGISESMEEILGMPFWRQTSGSYYTEAHYSKDEGEEGGEDAAGVDQRN